MKARNVSPMHIVNIVNKLNEEVYGGNVLVENIKRESGTTVSFKLGTADNRAKGSRRSWQGRHGRWACTHVFEDVMRKIVDQGGTVVIPKGSPGNNTGTALKLECDWDVDMWADAYNCTNVGSQVEPCYPEMQCVDCDD